MRFDWIQFSYWRVAAYPPFDQEGNSPSGSHGPSAHLPHPEQCRPGRRRRRPEHLIYPLPAPPRTAARAPIVPLPACPCAFQGRRPRRPRRTRGQAGQSGPPRTAARASIFSLPACPCAVQGRRPRRRMGRPKDGPSSTSFPFPPRTYPDCSSDQRQARPCQPE